MTINKINIIHLVAFLICITSSLYSQNEVIKKIELTKNNPGIPKSNGVTKNVSIYKNVEGVKFELLNSIDNNVIIIDNDNFQLHYKIHSANELNESHVITYVDGAPYEVKGNIVSLFNKDNILDYKRAISFKTGLHEVYVCVEKDNKKTCSKPFNIRNGENDLTIGAILKEESIAWITPDPIFTSEEVLDYSEPLLEIEFQVISNQNLDRSDVYIYVNEKRFVLNESAEVSIFGKRLRIKEKVNLADIDIGDINIVIKTLGSYETLISKTLKINFNLNKPNLHVISIGTKTNLDYTVKDAIDFASLYKYQGEGKSLYNEVIVKQITGKKAKTNEIRGVIEELTAMLEYKEIKEEDIVVIFMSTHGFLLDGDLRLQGDDYDPLRKRSTSVSYQLDILNPLEELKCKKLLFIDACHSGGAKSGVSDLNQALTLLNQKSEGLTVITSSRSNESSYEDKKWRNGAFTEAMVQGLSVGKADFDNNKIISIRELFSFLESEIPSMVLEVKNESQHPQMVRNELDDLPIYLLKK